MENVAPAGIDLAKKIFCVTAVDGAGAVVDRKRHRRAGLQYRFPATYGGCQ